MSLFMSSLLLHRLTLVCPLIHLPWLGRVVRFGGKEYASRVLKAHYLFMDVHSCVVVMMHGVPHTVCIIGANLLDEAQI